MNPLEHQLQYPFGDTLPAPGSTMELAPGLRWLRMPLPFALDHINLWLLRDCIEGQQGWTIIDCGISGDEVKTLWMELFKTQLEGLPVLRVIVTHMHPDHTGLASWLCEQWNAPLYMSMTDYMTAKLWTVSKGGASGGESAARHLGRHGMVDPEALRQVRERAGYYPSLVPSMPPSYIRLLHGSALTINGHRWEAIVGYGHAPEHISLYCADLNLLI